jgi:hypothetical protein
MTGSNTRARSEALFHQAVEVLNEYAVGDDRPVDMYEASQAMMRRAGCSVDTAKRHLARAARLMQEQGTRSPVYVDPRGGARRGAGWKKGRARKQEGEGKE